MEKLKYLYSALIIVFYNTYILAAPQDHGREDFSDNSFGLGDLFGYALLFVVCVMGIAMFFKNLFSDDSQHNKTKSNGNSSPNRIISEMNPIYHHSQLCYKCYGKGYVKGEEINRHTCLTCGGKGHIESAKASSLYKKYKEMRRPRSDENPRLTLFKAAPIYAEYLKELEKCPKCPDCSKYQDLDESDIYTDFDGRKYLKIPCDQCKGTGWTTRKLV